MGTAVLHPVEAEITEMVVLVVVETMVMAVPLLAEMTGTVVLPLVEMTEMAEEAVTQRETRGMLLLLLLCPNGGAPQPGHVGLPPPQ